MKTFIDCAINCSRNVSKFGGSGIASGLLKLIMSQTGEGTITPTVGEHKVKKGTSVTLSANESNIDYYFNAWIKNGNILSTDLEYLLTVLENQNIDGEFLAWTYIFDILKNAPLYDSTNKNWYLPSSVGSLKTVIGNQQLATFDGSDDFGTFANNLTWLETTTNAWTLEIKGDWSSVNWSPASAAGIFNDQLSIGEGFRLNVTTTGSLYLYLRKTSTSNEIIVSITDHPTKSLTYTYDGSRNANNINVYVDGALVSKTVVTNNLTSNLTSATWYLMKSATAAVALKLHSLKIWKSVKSVDTTDVPDYIEIYGNHRNGTILHELVSGNNLTLSNITESTFWGSFGTGFNPIELTRGVTVYVNNSDATKFINVIGDNNLSISGYTKDAYYAPGSGALYSLSNNYTIPVDTDVNEYLPAGAYTFAQLDAFVQTVYLRISKTSKSITELIVKKKIVDNIVLPSILYFIKDFSSSMFVENILYKNLLEAGDVSFSEGVKSEKYNTFDFDTASVDQSMILLSTGKTARHFDYKVVNKSTNNGKSVNILWVGDSFTDMGTHVKRTTSLLNADGVSVNQIGTTGNSTFKSESQSGSAIYNCFLDSSIGVARIIHVTGVTTVPETAYPGVFYLDDNGVQRKLRGGKIDQNGNGKLVATRYGATEADFVGFPTSGVMTKMSGQESKEGDAIIHYNGIESAYYNPCINHSTGLLDLSFYIDYWEFDEPDIVVFQFTVNDVGENYTDEQIAGVVDNFIAAADHVHSEYPDCKIIFSFEPYYSSVLYANFDLKKAAVLKFIGLMIETFEGEDYSDFVYLAPSYAYVDLVNDYGTDYVHCLDSGMNKIGECIYQVISNII